MKRLRMDVFAVHDNYSDDGRAPSFVRAYFTEEADARKCAKHDCHQMGGGSVEREEVDFKVFENYMEFQKDEEEETRREALKRLSDKEIRALGLSRPLP